MGLDFDELLDEIESIVYSGTKLNIDYFLRDVMDDDAIDDIFDYFMEASTQPSRNWEATTPTKTYAWCASSSSQR